MSRPVCGHPLAADKAPELGLPAPRKDVSHRRPLDQSWASYRRMGLGPRFRIDMMRNLVTALVRHERIETTLPRADEMSFDAEKLVDYAKQGDTDEKAMKMADFWLMVSFSGAGMGEAAGYLGSVCVASVTPPCPRRAALVISKRLGDAAV